LPCARNKHTAKTTFCYVSFVAHGKEYILPCVFFFAVCCRSWHTANILHCRVSTALPCAVKFAVCPFRGTRQRFWHTGNYEFPVVRDESGRDRSGKYPNHFRFHIFIRKRKQERESSVGKTKSVIRDIGNGTIRSEVCR